METTQTWHYGLVAEWWANFNTDGPEIEYFRRHVEQAQPVLDAGCGTGRLLVPWLQAGIDVDGCDASADMVALCRERARREGFEPTLFVQPLHVLDPPRRYGSIVACGVFGLGSTRAQDAEALRRLRAALEPGGTLLLDNQVPYSNTNQWPRWTKAGRDELPSDWSAGRARVARRRGRERVLAAGPQFSRSTPSTSRRSSSSVRRSEPAASWSRKSTACRCGSTSATSCS